MQPRKPTEQEKKSYMADKFFRGIDPVTIRKINALKAVRGLKTQAEALKLLVDAGYTVLAEIVQPDQKEE